MIAKKNLKLENTRNLTVQTKKITWNFKQLSQKPGIIYYFICKITKFQLDTKVYHKNFFELFNFFSLKNTFKVA